jgi:hypothetical protein
VLIICTTRFGMKKILNLSPHVYYGFRISLKINDDYFSRFYRVQTMVYNTENSWGFGLRPSSGSSFRNVVFLSSNSLESGRRTKSENRLILWIISLFSINGSGFITKKQWIYCEVGIEFLKFCIHFMLRTVYINLRTDNEKISGTKV